MRNASLSVGGKRRSNPWEHPRLAEEVDINALDFERAAFLRDQLRELKELPELVLVNSKKKKSEFITTKKLKRNRKQKTEDK